MTYTINLQQLSNEFCTNGHIVGFTKHYFTLWNYSITTNADNEELVLDAYFIKNIGKTNPYASAYPFDEGLKGKVLD